LNAMFANSPFSKSKFTGYMSYRSYVTLNSGLPQFRMPKDLYESDFSYDAWIDHLFGLPFLFMENEGQWTEASGGTFQDYFENGFNGHRATDHDFLTHIKTAWKDVKLKEVIELRYFDALPPSLTPSVAALIKGLAYSENNLKYLEKMTSTWSYQEFQNLQMDAAKYGIRATMKGRPLLDIAKELIKLAEVTLKEDRIVDAFEYDERQYLEPIKEFIFLKEKSPAEWLVEQWEGEWGRSFFPVFKWCQY